jgi:hypothetical protein
MIRGTKATTWESALRLQRGLGVPGHVWTRLEGDYCDNRARLADQRA